MGRRFAPLELNEAELAELTSLASRRSTAQGFALRARIILACAEGEQSKVIAVRLGIDPDTVGKWRRRFAEHRLEGLWDEPRSGTPRPKGFPAGFHQELEPPHLAKDFCLRLQVRVVLINLALFAAMLLFANAGAGIWIDLRAQPRDMDGEAC